MRTITFFVFVLLWLTGCSKYQYVTLNSDVVKTDNGSLVIDNDTLSVSYSFSGENGVARIAVKNKLGIPLQVDLNTAVLTRISWPSQKGPFTASLKPEIDHYVRPRYEEIQWHEVKEIAPLSEDVTLPVVLRKNFFHISTPDMVAGELNGDKIRIQYFDPYKSPLIVVSKINYSTGSGNIQRISQEFWVDEAFTTMSKPEHVHRIKGRKDMFFVKKDSGFGYFLGALGLFIYLAASQAAQ